MLKPKSASAIDEDAFLASEIAKAVSFTAHLRVGPREKYTETHPDYEAAKGAVERLVAEHSRFGRGGMVYAITPRGDTIPCTDDLVALARLGATYSGRRA